MVIQSSIVVHLLFIYYHSLLYIFIIIIDRAVGAPGHGKNAVEGMNARDKQKIKLEMAKLINLELIWDEQTFPSSCRFMKMNNTKMEV